MVALVHSSTVTVRAWRIRNPVVGFGVNIYVDRVSSCVGRSGVVSFDSAVKPLDNLCCRFVETRVVEKY